MPVPLASGGTTVSVELLVVERDGIAHVACAMVCEHLVLTQALCEGGGEEGEGGGGRRGEEG